MNKLKIWQPGRSWDESEASWEASAKEAAREHPIKRLKQLPSMPGITSDTAHRLKWKSLQYMVGHDSDGSVRRGFLRHPFRYLKGYLRSLFRTDAYRRDGDFFLYGVSDVHQFKGFLKDPQAVFLMGFSYCHKPFECPSGRFTDQCQHNLENPVCRQCFIGKAVHAAPERGGEVVFIPTVHYIGAKIFELVERYPGRPLLFLITACELTLEMFSDWGNMVGIQGVGVRLDGRICNTMKAFELSERGVKPGLTVVLDDTQKRMLELIRWRREALED